MASERDAPAGLIVSNPVCRMCREEVEHDGDDWHCVNCRAYWEPGAEEERGSWDDPEEEQCPAQARDRSKTHPKTFRCAKGAGHVEGGTDDERKHHGWDGGSWPGNSWLEEIEPVAT